MRPGTSCVWGLAVAGLLLFALGFIRAGDLQELREQFEAALDAKKDSDARSIGKRILAQYPDDLVSLDVLRAFHEKEWKWPRLRTSYPVLLRWEQDVVDGIREPELRLKLILALEAMYPREDVVKRGGTLYEKAITSLRAGRPKDAVKFSKLYLDRFKGSRSADKIRVVVLAEALLALDPPKTAAARKVLEEVAAKPKSRYRERASRRLDSLASGEVWIPIKAGCPRVDGLGRMVLLTDLPAKDALIEAVKPWVATREAKVLRFRSGKPTSAAKALRKLGPEFVAVVVRPEDLDVNFHWQMLRLCRELDPDPLPDFHFGYLVARDAKDLRAFAERSAEAGPRQDPRIAQVSAPKSAASVENLDGFLHFGHGNPYEVIGAIHANDLSEGCLPRAPLIVSGACFNGVVGRSWHDSALQWTFLPPVTVKPEEALSLAWVRAGAIGLVAAMEGDRGEMASAEWAHLKQAACPLGEVPGLSYRLAFTSLPESFTEVPAYRSGAKRSTSLYDVMLRGQLSRVLIGDPSVRILGDPTESPASNTSVRQDEEGRLVFEVEPTKSSFLWINTLTRAGFKNTFTESRLWARMEVPEDVGGRLLPPEISVEAGGSELELIRTCVRHEVWGEKRFVCVQVESKDRRLAMAGTKATFAFGTLR